MKRPEPMYKRRSGAPGPYEPAPPPQITTLRGRFAQRAAPPSYTTEQDRYKNPFMEHKPLTGGYIKDYTEPPPQK